MRPIGIARLLTVAAVLAASASMPAAPANQPFAALAPGVRIDADEQGRLDAGQAMVKVLPARDRELAVAAAVRIDVSPERFIAWHRQIAALHRSRYVPLIARFSDPPRIEDLDGLTLSAEDLADIHKCRPGDCGVKLSAPEIERLRHIPRDGDWEHQIQQEFRRLVLARVSTYLAEGDGATRRASLSPAVSASRTPERGRVVSVLGDGNFGRRSARRHVRRADSPNR